MEVKNLKVASICPSWMNPRKEFDQESIDELAANIEKQGLLQPITVRPCCGDVEKVESDDFGDSAYEKFKELKTKHPEALLLFRCGDFYECYEENAQKAADILGITVVSKKAGRKNIKMSGFPTHSLDAYLPKLVRKGTRIAICDKLFDWKKYNTSSPSGIRLNAKGETVEYEYEIVCGERRYRAVKKLGHETIPAIVREMTDEEAFDAMVTENLQRKDVNPIEECMAYVALMEKGNTTKDLAVRFGKSERYISDRTRLHGLIKELHKPLKDGIIPIRGAIMLAKCDQETQKAFLEDFDVNDDEPITFSDIKDFIEDDFMRLDNVSWIDDDGGEEWNTEGTPCKNCFKNTANHGCLFYEMKGDAQCTDRACFQQKKLEYRKWFVSKQKVVMKGEEPTPDKVLLVSDGVPSWKYDTFKEQHKKMSEWAKAQGYEVRNTSSLGSRCWYSEDDERLLKMLSEGKVLKCFYVYEDYRFDFTYIYTDSKSESVGVREEKDVLIENYRRIVEKNDYKFGEAAAKALGDMEYTKQNDPVSAIEDNIIYLILLDKCGYRYLHESEVDYKKRIDWLREHPEKREEIRRRAIYEYCNYMGNGDIAVALLSDKYPVEYEELKVTFNQKAEKSTQKTVERLRELGYNPDGSKINDEE